MTREQESRLSMYLTLKDYLAPYSTITTALPNYQANFTLFVAGIPLIQGVSEQQKTSKKGIAVGKNQLKESLIVMAADYARKLGAYAKFTANATLAEEMKLPVSMLRQAADTAVKDYAQILYNRAQPLVASLALYGITAATQTALAGAITAYNASLGKPGAVRSEGTQITKQLSALFKASDVALDNMDAAVEIVRLTQVNFYNGYKSARKIIATGGSSLSVKGLPVDTATGLPLKGVAVEFSLADGADKIGDTLSKDEVVKKTADKGGFNVKGLASGVYKVRLKKAGYADQVTTVSVNDGEMTEVSIRLAKA